MHVRDADRDDAEAIVSIARASWHAAYGGFLSEGEIDATVDEWYAPETLRRHIAAAGAFLVSEADSNDGADGEGGADGYDAGRLLGFAHVRYAPEVGNVVIRRIYVHPDAWGGGIGTALLGAVARRFADDHEQLSTVVFAENEVGLSFYERHGFEMIGQQTTAFGGEEHDERIVVADLDDLAELAPGAEASTAERTDGTNGPD
ncbi:GNAT family N-acetyltransferase [Halobaculum magnesiiphilum]|uniref:GNAT family N-acetyltransferase n=1 Tax=Halobaculum magnesiiphilum TaxID=1017351 RepID=A0A8T8WFL4_9EURY|nr:GNAT family N-acetyltransferase [Halobaculum magnesiiphilum]QZP38523.1 GNAT family N-acetyltransferase [Halobaculum magnesiiphilum]